MRVAHSTLAVAVRIRTIGRRARAAHGKTTESTAAPGSSHQGARWFSNGTAVRESREDHVPMRVCRTDPLAPLPMVYPPLCLCLERRQMRQHVAKNDMRETGPLDGEQRACDRVVGRGHRHRCGSSEWVEACDVPGPDGGRAPPAPEPLGDRPDAPLCVCACVGVCVGVSPCQLLRFQLRVSLALRRAPLLLPTR